MWISSLAMATTTFSMSLVYSKSNDTCVLKCLLLLPVVHSNVQCYKCAPMLTACSRFCTVSTQTGCHRHPDCRSPCQFAQCTELLPGCPMLTSSSYQWVQRSVLVQDVSRVLMSKGRIPLNHVGCHPDGISCLHRVPAPVR